MLDREAPAAYLADQENPFAETLEETTSTPGAIGFAPWSDSETPFLSALDGPVPIIGGNSPFS